MKQAYSFSRRGLLEVDILRTYFCAKSAVGILYRNRWPCRTDKDSLWNYLSLCLVLLGTALVILTFRDYGVTWDEPLHNWYGNLILDHYLSFFRDKDPLHWDDIYFYGAAFDMAAAAINRFSSLGTYETRHLLNGLVG